MAEEPKGNPKLNARRDEISDSYEPIRSEPSKEVVKEEPVGEEKVESKEEPKSEPKQEGKEKPKRKYGDLSPEELEKKYDDSIKGMNEAQMKAANLEKQFQQIREFVDWDRLKAKVSGQSTQPTNQPVVDEVKQRFFEDFANRGPQFLDERVFNAVKQVAPQIIQVASFQTKLADAYEDFTENHPDLQPFEEQVGKLMFEKLQADPKKTIRKAMKESISEFKKTLEAIKLEGKKEATVAYEEKKRENIPSSERASKEIAKPTEENPETLDDVVSWRLRQKDKYQSVRKRPEL